MIERYKIFFVLLSLVTNLFAKKAEVMCGASFDRTKASSEELKRMDAYNQNMEQLINNNNNLRTTSISSNDQFILIPVVFHVV